VVTVQLLATKFLSALAPSRESQKVRALTKNRFPPSALLRLLAAHSSFKGRQIRPPAAGQRGKNISYGHECSGKKSGNAAVPTALATGEKGESAMWSCAILEAISEAAAEWQSVTDLALNRKSA
jgi:hypothetical protein